MEHRTRSIERDLEWIDELIASERDAMRTSEPSASGGSASTAAADNDRPGRSSPASGAAASVA